MAAPTVDTSPYSSKFSQTFQGVMDKIKPKQYDIPQIGDAFDLAAASAWRNITEGQAGATKTAKDQVSGVRQAIDQSLGRAEYDIGQGQRKMTGQASGAVGRSGLRGTPYADTLSQFTEGATRGLQDIVAGGTTDIDRILQDFIASETRAAGDIEDVIGDAAGRAETRALKAAEDKANTDAINASNLRIQDLTTQITNITKQIQSQPQPTPTGQIAPPPPMPTPPAPPPQLPSPGPTDPFGRTIRPGQQKADIRALQNVLRSKGFDPGPADGVWGHATNKAYQEWMRMSGADPNTPLDSGRVHEIFIWNRPTGGQPLGGQVSPMQSRPFMS